MTTRQSALPTDQLDKATTERIGRLMATDPMLLTPGDRDFLKARQDYLTAAQRADYLAETPLQAVNEEDGDEYDELGKEALKDILRDRGLAVGGKVDELRDRLRADDEATEEDPELEG